MRKYYHFGKATALSVTGSTYSGSIGSSGSVRSIKSEKMTGLTSSGDNVNFSSATSILSAAKRMHLLDRFLCWARGTHDIRWTNNPKESIIPNLALVHDFNDKKFSKKDAKTGLNPHYDEIRKQQNTTFKPSSLVTKGPVGLYRGTRPASEAEYLKLHKRYNVGYVIDLRGGGPGGDKDVDSAKKLLNDSKILNGRIKHYHIPMSSQKPPTSKELHGYSKQLSNGKTEWVPGLHEIIAKAKAEGKSVYIHCKYGVDRTGIMCAEYEMKTMGFTPEQALEGMKKRGYDLTHSLFAPQRAMRIYLLGKQTWVDQCLNKIHRVIDRLKKAVLPFLQKHLHILK